MKLLVSLASVAVLATLSAQAGYIDRIALDRKAERHQRARSLYQELTTSFFSLTHWKNPLPTRFAKTGTFDQKLDHFSKTDDRSFKQRYWIDSAAAAGADAPVIYYICGESRCDGAGGGFAVALAEELKAHVVTLEHRYYGDSIPTSSYSATELRYLSTDQAIADLATFQKYVMKELGLTGRWISIGGSYPGSLSAYYRLSHPELVTGSLASSGPVEARANFEEYDYQVATAVSPKCLSRIQDAVSTIEADLKDASTRASTKALFGSEKIDDDDDFLYVVADMAAASIQYGELESFCSTIESAAKDALVPSYAKAGLAMFRALGITPIEDTPQGNLSEDPSNYTGNGMRQWLYQSCTEFGYWQVAYHDPKLSSRSSRINLAYHDGICSRLFGIHKSVDTGYILKNYYQPLVAGRADRILFTNGAVDPWKHLSIRPDRGNVPKTVDAMEIAGAAHCDDLGDASTAAVKKAQDLFRDLVHGWLK